MNKNIPQLATVKINCNEEIGTAVIFFPDTDVEYVYILTAKHCLTGKDFDKDFTNTDIILENIFNEEESTYYSYNLTETDIVLTSEDKTEDMALFILPKKNILSLTGKQFFCQVTDTQESVQEYEVRGFANFNDQEADRSFQLKFEEDQKDDRSKFLLRSEISLDTFFQQALENVEGLSGSGAYSHLYGNIYFTGITYFYESTGIFLATKVLAYNKLVPPGFAQINATKPETSQDVLTSYSEIEKNEIIVNARTNEKIGNFNVPRDKTDLVRILKNNGITIVHGNPGVGKSALTKSVVADVKASGEYSILTLTAENLYCESLMEALTNAGCKVGIQQLMSSPLSNKYFLIWIESFEKLIESNYSGAFHELLELVKKNRNVSIILTIRDYLLQKFKINYQFELPENTAYFQVNEFNDSEIELIRQELPELNTLFDNHKINHLLRTPYYLDRAVRIIPELLKEEQLDEKRFKKLMWDHIVKKDNARRGKVFYEICLKRSREMSLFTRYDEDEEIIADLVKDNILQVDNSSDGNTFSASHDILEDWALVRFIRKQKEDALSAKDFLLSVEMTPAMKRAFRLWLEEFYVNEPEDSVNFVHQLLSDDTLQQSWKDELLIVSLRSNHAEILLESLKDQFLLDNGFLLKKIISLLQTGCKRIDPVKRDFNQMLPVGTGWDFIIDFIKENLVEINKMQGFQAQYLNLIEVWSKQLPEFNQQLLPKGAKSAAYILENFIYEIQTRSKDDRLYRSGSDYLNKYIAILFKLTAADPELIRLLINAAESPQTGNTRWTNKGILFAVRDSIVDGVLSDQICRFFPDSVFLMAQKKWAKREVRHTPRSLSSMIVREPDSDDFGLNDELKYYYRTSSAYQTFFYWMFLHHPQRAIDFVIPFLNTAFNVNQNILSVLKDDMLNVSITFEDATVRSYYGNYDYWTMFRGFSASNELVTSLLMGLERSLLDLVDRNDIKTTQKYVKLIIEESNNTAMLGVVSSILQSNSAILDPVSVSLLGIPLFFKWDSTRSTTDYVSKRDVFNQDAFERKERIESNGRLHRNKYNLGLVGFVAHYMFYQRSLNNLLFEQIDRMWQNVSSEDVMFKKFLFDMDARTYEFKPIEEQGYENYVQLIPDYDEEVQGILKNPPEHPTINVIWARAAFDKDVIPNHNYETWKIGYDFIIRLHGKRDPMVAPGTMAAVALRDFSDQLQPEELFWCREVIINFAKRKLENKDPYSIDFDAIDNRPTFFGLSYLFRKELDPADELKVKEMIFRLLLAQLDNVERTSLQGGMAQDLFLHQQQFVINCWCGFIEFIRLEQERNAEYKRKKDLYNRGELSYNDLQNIEYVNIEELVLSVVNGTIQPPEQISVSLDRPTYKLLDDALRMISWKTDFSAHHEFVKSVLKMHLDFLNNPNLSNYPDYNDSRSTFRFFYARFLLNQPAQISEPLFIELLDLILDFKEKNRTVHFLKFVYDLVQEFIRAVNEGQSVENFWMLWEHLRRWMINNKKVFFMPLFLMDIEWSSSADKWSVLNGKNLYYKNFINEWGSNQVKVCIKFLSGIAFHNFMPDSISWIALLLYSNSSEVDIDVLENFVEKAFYQYGGKIKRDQEILLYYLFILEFLIRKESPKAYMLKDELLQYKMKV